VGGHGIALAGAKACGKTERRRHGMSSEQGKTILVTGGSSGLGQACGQMLAERGARLVLVGRREQELREAFPDPAHVIVTSDVTDETSLQALAANLKTAGISLQGVVPAAGMQDIRPLAMETMTTLSNSWMVNVYGSLGLLAVLLKSRLIAKGASIVLFSSGAAKAGGPGLVAYAAAKGALEAAAHSLALELASQRIRVNAIAPGVIPTPMSSRYMSRMTSAQAEMLKAHHPLGLGEPQDVANLVGFLLSDEAKWITGSVIQIDGGLTSH
jgi:NAD(P)-dependent dehydrogenase (short-subunit alcohol dehydrogenase family)